MTNAPMKTPLKLLRLLLPAALCLLTVFPSSSRAASSDERHFMYVAVPGIRNYLEFGGHGVLVFDIDNGHKFVRRIPAVGLDAAGKPENVKGTCASAVTRRLYVSSLTKLACFDLLTDKVIWEKKYD